MGLFDFLGFGKQKADMAKADTDTPSPKTPSLQTNELQNAMMRFFPLNQAAYDITQDPKILIEQTYARNADVYAVVNMIVKSAVSVPKLLFKAKDQNALKAAKRKQEEVQAKYRMLTKSETHIPLSLFLKDENTSEILDHPLLGVLDRPNEYQTGAEMEEFSLAMLLIAGNLYEYGLRVRSGNDKGKIWEVWNVYPQQIRLVPANGDLVNQYEIIYRDVRVGKEAIMHVKYFNPLWDQTTRGLYGMSPLFAGRQLIALSNAGYDNISRIFQSGGLTGIVSPSRHEPGMNAFTSTQAQQVQEQIDQSAKSSRGSRIHVTTAPISWSKIGDTMEEMQALESQMHTKRAICDLYNVSSALFNDAAGTTFNNMSEARKALYTNAVIPLLRKYDQARQNWFVKSWQTPGESLHIERDLSVIPELQPDKTELMTALQNLTYLTVNEKRAILNYADYKDAEADKLSVGNPANSQNNTQPVNGQPANQQEIDKAIEWARNTLLDYAD